MDATPASAKGSDPASLPWPGQGGSPSAPAAAPTPTRRSRPRATVHVGRRLPGAFAAAAATLVLALALQSPGLVAAGLMVGLVATLAPRLPKSLPIDAAIALRTPTGTEQEPLDVTVKVANRGWRTRLVDLRTVLPQASALAPGEGDDSGPLVLGRGGEEDRSFTLLFHLFGLQRIGPVQARQGDPFGLAAVEQEAAPAVDVRVYPRRESLRDPVLKAKQIRAVLGRYDIAQPGHSFEFYGLRDYTHGDRPRDVNWKASARVGSLIVNQHQKESDAEVVVLVDARAATLVGRASLSPFAQACRAALAISEAHLKGRDSVRLVAYGRDVHEDRHTGATRRMQGLLDLAVGLEAAGDMPLADVVHRILPSLKRRSPVMVFSPLVGDPTVADAVSLLQSHDLPVSVLVPTPDWGEGTPAGDRALWDARQKLAVRGLRRLGLPVAVHSPGNHLLASLDTLEVRA